MAASKKKSKAATKNKGKKSVKKPVKKSGKKPLQKSVKKSAPKSAKKSAPSQAKPKVQSSAKTKSPTPQKISTPKVTAQNTKTLAFAKVFNPLDDRILVDVLPAETKTAGGLYIPDSGQEKPERGIVVAVGPGKRNKKAQLRPLDVKIGDEIIFAKYAGTAIQILGKEVFILREDEVLGIVN